MYKYKVTSSAEWRRDVYELDAEVTAGVQEERCKH